MNHLVVVRDIAAEPGQDLWRADCSCGWVGTEAPEVEADRQGAAHQQVVLTKGGES